MIVKAIDKDGRAVRQCTVSDHYTATSTYQTIKRGDASTHGGRVVAWHIIDAADRVVEKIPAPGLA